MKKILLMFALYGALRALCAPTDESKTSNPIPARDRYEALVKEIETARSEWSKAYDKAKTDAERDKLHWPAAEEYANRFLAIAKEQPKDPAAVDALVWVASNCRESDAQKTSLALLLKHHLGSTNLGAVASALIYAKPTEAEPWLRAVLKDSPHHQVKARAAYALGRVLVQEGERAEAEKLFEDLVAHYADVKSYKRTMDDLAKGELFEMRHLAIGQVAPEIEGADVDGKNFKLSDYRGKVVVIDFWGDW